MDKHLAVNVYDENDNAISGASVTYKVKFKGQDLLLGPIDIQGVKDQPASIQIPTPIDDPVIEVTATYNGHSKAVLVDTRQTATVVVRLPVKSPLTTDHIPPNPDANPTPWKVLSEARKAVPAVDYALGVAGIGAAGAIINLFLGPTQASIVIVALIFVGMLLLFAFSQLAVAKSRSTQIAGAVLLWAVLIFFITFLGFTVTAFAAEWPKPWARFLGIIKEAPGLTNAHPKIPGGTGWIFLGYSNQAGIFTEGPKAEVVSSTRKSTEHFFEIGNTIRLKLPSKVIVVDYATDKSDKNLVSPIEKGIISAADYTGVVIPAGTELILRDISRGSWPGNPNTAIWGRVVYANEN